MKVYQWFSIFAILGFLSVGNAFAGWEVEDQASEEGVSAPAQVNLEQDCCWRRGCRVSYAPVYYSPCVSYSYGCNYGYSYGCSSYSVSSYSYGYGYGYGYPSYGYGYGFARPTPYGGYGFRY